MPRVVSANWFSENVSHLCVISHGRIASLLHLAPLYLTCISFPPTFTMMHLCITQCTYWTPLTTTTIINTRSLKTTAHISYLHRYHYHSHNHHHHHITAMIFVVMVSIIIIIALTWDRV